MAKTNIRMIGNSWWKGCALLLIDALPQTIDDGELTQLLQRCAQPFSSVELCAFSSPDALRLSLLLIVRYEEGSVYQVRGWLEDQIALLAGQLEAAGFRMHAADEDDEQVRLAAQILGERSGEMMGASFFPGDRLLGDGGYYVPGAYERGTLEPLNWVRLADAIMRHPLSMVCIQLINTRLTDGERWFVRENRAFFGARKGEDAMTASRAYARYCALENAPLVMVNCFCLGSLAFHQNARAIMHSLRYSEAAFPGQSLASAQYLLFGDAHMREHTARRGHTPPCLRAMEDAQAYRYSRLSHLATLSDVAALFPLPLDTREIPGIAKRAVTGRGAAVPQALLYTSGREMAYLGCHALSGAPLGMPLKALCRHGVIVGKSGSGKTSYAMGLLHQLWQKGVPFLAIESAKREYRSMLGAIPELQIYTPGLSQGAPLQINLFLPSAGVTLGEYLPTLETLFEATIAVDHPLDVIFPQVIRECYSRYGWRQASTRDSQGATWFGMHEFILCFQDFIRREYAAVPEARENLEAGGVTRLAQLINDFPEMLDTVRSVDVAQMLQKPTVIELEAIHNARQKALVTLVLLTQAVHCIKQASGMDRQLSCVIFIDEAHNLLGGQPAQEHAAQAAVRLLQDMIRELRAYGVALLFGDQTASALTRDIVEGVNMRVMFRLDSQQDRALLRDVTGLEHEMLLDMAALPAGHAYLSLDTDLKPPLPIVTDDYKRTLLLSPDVTNAQIAQIMRTTMRMPFIHCVHCARCAGACDTALRMDAWYVAQRLFDTPEVREITGQNADEAALRAMTYAKRTLPGAADAHIKEQGLAPQDRERFYDCVRVQLLRMLERGGCRIPAEAILAGAQDKVQSGRGLLRSASTP